MDLPREEVLKYIGQDVTHLPTPSVTLDREIILKNCQTVLNHVAAAGATLRAHVKTLKCSEVTRLMLGGKHHSVAVSTLREARGLLDLVSEGIIDNILYAFPPPQSAIQELKRLSKLTRMILMIDHENQLEFLERDASESGLPSAWDIFIKIDIGYGRAGVPVDSDQLRHLVKRAKGSSAVSIYGFYCHAGHSYGCSTEADAAKILDDEIKAVCAAASLEPLEGTLTLSVGATPTVHAFHSRSWTLPPNCKLELHGGNYPVNDLQQVATGQVPREDQAMQVIAEVCSIYPQRNEALVNAGVLALSRETGRIPGFGVISIAPDWHLGRLSQEHGILVCSANSSAKIEEYFQIGQKVRISVQHACITAAAHGWYFILDSDGIVRDIWFPWKGW